MAIQTNHYDSNTIGNLNRRFANELGWKSKYQQIKFILNITKTLPDPMDFAQAVSNWQALHPPLKTDGLLGPNTWKRLKLNIRYYMLRYLFIYTYRPSSFTRRRIHRR